MVTRGPSGVGGGCPEKLKKNFFWIFYMFKEYNLRFIIISILLSSLLNSVIGIKFISSIGMDVEKFHLHLMTCIYICCYFLVFLDLASRAAVSASSLALSNSSSSLCSLWTSVSLTCYKDEK